MDEEEKNEYPQAEVVCGDCTGNVVQVQKPVPEKRLFTPVFFIKWVYLCQKCGKESKVFCSRINNKVG